VGIKEFQKRFPDQNIKMHFPTPGTYAIGISNSAFWNSTIAFDFTVQDYRRFKDVIVNFTQTKDTGTPAEARLTFDFRNSYAWRFGIEKPWNTNTIFRAGYFFDRTPVPDKSVGPLWPDSSRHNFTLGVSRRMGNKEFSFFYQAMQFINRTTNVPANVKQLTNGHYNNYANLAGFSMRIHLGSPTIDTGR
jgi:long-chain fatty acid transport protein